MSYSFEILGVSPVLQFFNQQQEIMQQQSRMGVEYLGSHQCTLDAVLSLAETAAPRRGWPVDRVVDTVIQFWLQNADRIHYWKHRLEDAGNQNLLVARLADFQALKAEFELLLDRG